MLKGFFAKIKHYVVVMYLTYSNCSINVTEWDKEWEVGDNR